MSALADWVLLAALHFAPLETRPQFRGFEEARDEAFGRYLGIAADIAAAAEEHPGSDAEKRRRADHVVQTGLSRHFAQAAIRRIVAQARRGIHRRTEDC